MVGNLACTRYWGRADLWRYTCSPRLSPCCTFSSSTAAIVASSSSFSSPDSASSSTYCDQQSSAVNNNWRRPLGSTPSSSSSSSSSPLDTQLHQTPIVALGKFDALHRGHQALAIAAAELGGTPWLVSFAGMAEVLHWPSRLPLVAPIDRTRVMQTWQAGCGGILPIECSLPFAEVRSLSPEEFIILLATELRVGGVAVGSNYRFGYKAAGDASLLRNVAPQYGLKVAIVDLVRGQKGNHETTTNDGGGDSDSLVSSSWVRHALSVGDVAAAQQCLGRPYRLVVDRNNNNNNNNSSSSSSSGGLTLSSSFFLNQPPAMGRYPVLLQVASESDTTLGHVSEGRPAEVAITEEGIEIVKGPENVQMAQGGKIVVLDFVV